MSIKQKLTTMKIEAMKSRDKGKVDTLNLVLSTIKNKEIAKQTSELTDSEVVTVLQTELKQTRESLTYAEKSAKVEEIEKLNTRISLIEELLPSQMTPQEVEKVVVELLQKNNINSKAQMGEAMKIVMGNLKGKAEGSIINQVVKKLLV